MQSGDGNIPAERENGAAEKDKNPGHIFRSWLKPPRWCIVGRTHGWAPMVK